MHLIITLFWIGLLIVLALFVFKVVVTLLMFLIVGIGAGIATLWGKLTR